MDDFVDNYGWADTFNRTMRPPNQNIQFTNLVKLESFNYYMWSSYIDGVMDIRYC